MNQNQPHHHSDVSEDRSDHHSMMEMSFHAGFIETIIFAPWITTSVPLFIGSWIFIFILGILHEGIRKLRQYLEAERLIKSSIILDKGNEIELERMNTESSESTVPVNKKISPRYTERVLDSILYAIQLALSYILMLIAMTFNVYLFLAIIFGIGTGHFLYTWNFLMSSTSKQQRHT